MLQVKQKTVDLLKYISIDLKPELRKKALEELSSKYKMKQIYAKLEELSDKGYVEYGGNIVAGWLTPKGKELLEMINDNKVKVY